MKYAIILASVLGMVSLTACSETNLHKQIKECKAQTPMTKECQDLFKELQDLRDAR